MMGLSAIGSTIEQEPLLLKDLGNIYHPVTSSNELATKYFKQGLAFVYAFNHDFAFRSFQMASIIDPTFAMAYWGMALSIGPNINSKMKEANVPRAYEYIQKALELSNGVSENERDYIIALSKRYSNNPQDDRKALDIAYKNAMGDVYKKYSQDLDAATLYAESMMDLTPWDFWTKSGDFKPGVQEVIDVLQNTLKKDPYHLGANHFYVHIFEGSKNPEYALTSAERLRVLYKESGHLLHMGAHIFLPTGFYQEAVLSNFDAIAQDKAYIKIYGKEGYPQHYMSHNMSSLIRALTLQGNFKEAIKWSDELYSFVIDSLKNSPHLEPYVYIKLYTYFTFNKWDEILKLQEPEDDLPNSKVIWHFARSYAFAAKNNLKDAEVEKALFLESIEKINASDFLGYNLASDILKIAQVTLDAKFLEVKGDLNASKLKLEESVTLQDNLSYNEPADWFMPQRILLGALLVKMGQYQEAVDHLEEELSRHPRNGRALFILEKAYNGLNMSTDAGWVKTAFEKAWKNADIELNINNF